MAQVIVELSGDEAKLLRSMQKVIEQGQKMGDSSKKTAKESREETSKFSKELQNIVGGYMTLGAAASGASAAFGVFKAVNADNLAIMKESLTVAEAIAKAQVGTVKNLTGLSSVDKARVLQEAKKLQAEIGFGDQTAIVNAIGSGFSASGDLETTKSAVRAGAELSRVTPEDLPTIASGAIDLSRGSGVKDAKKNLGFLLEVGAISRVEDPAALARTLAPTVANAVNTVPNQDKQEASKEVGAIFSELNKFTNDIKGESTKTNSVILLAKMEEFFRTIPEEREKINAEIAKLEEKLAVTPLESARLKRSDFEVAEKERLAKRFGTSQSPMALDARIDLETAQANKEQLLKDIGLDETETLRLKKIKEQQKALEGVTDPGTIMGRVRKINSSEGLRDKFLENPFGEAPFQGAFRQLLTQGSEFFANVEKNITQLSFNSKTFDSTVAQLETLSPELKVAKSSEAEKGRKQLSFTEGDKPFQGLVNEIATNALQENRRNAIGGALDFGYEGFSSFLAGSGTNATESATIAMTNLEMRKQAINSQIVGVGPADQTKLDRLEAAITKIAELLAENQVARTTESVAMDRKLMEDQNKILQSIDSKSGATPQVRTQQIRSQAEASR